MDNWDVVDDGEGNTYYIDRATGASQWEKPQELKDWESISG